MSLDIKPQYSKTRVKKAGASVRAGTASSDDYTVIENWRASHNHISNSWKSILRGRCKGKDIIFAQRLKRRNTIFNKLEREPDMSLSRMHDILGCRLIFKDIQQLNDYRESLHKSNMKHVRKSDERYNYIENPALSGYRGIHDVYEYNITRKDRPTDWNGLLVEIQYRTIFQHAWATAVEVAGSLTGNHSKFSHGSEEHIEFFRLTSEIIARTHENRTSCKSSLTNTELLAAFRALEHRIKLLRDLDAIRMVNKNLPKGKNFILIFNETNGLRELKFEVFDSQPLATTRYFKLEKEFSGKETDIVLVRSESSANIRNAFRNYFSDAEDFVKLVKKGLMKLKAL